MLLETLLKFKFVILFYLLIILFFVWKRSKVSRQAKIIFLYRMKWGISLMDYISTKYREWVILIGYVGIGVGFTGMVFISYYLVKNFVTALTSETIVAGASLVYPGMTVPGLGVLPFWDWIIALFMIATIHEFSHGVVARAHNVPIHNTGIVLFGPILGAFVEPDEKKMAKEKDIVQYSILAAGSFSNIALALIALLLLNFAAAPLQQGMTEDIGFTFDSYSGENMPFETTGISTGTLITGINGQTTKQFQNFQQELLFYRAGEKIKISTPDKEYDLTLGKHPDNPQKAYLGIQGIRNEISVKDTYTTGLANFGYNFIAWLTGFLRWLFLLSLGIGIFNLLPLPIVDGGRMAQVFLQKLKGVAKGNKIYVKVGIFFLLILLLNLVTPWIQGLF